MYSHVRPLAALCLVFFVVTISSGNSSKSTDSTVPATTGVTVSIDVLSNRHAISKYVYGGAYPKDAPTITDSGLSVVRWGGNSTSRYNWQLQTYNAANDWFFEDFGYSEIGDSDSAKYIQDVKAAGSNPIMTMVMLPWVAKSSGWSFSVAKYGTQCAADPYNTDAGDGLKTDCSTTLTANPSDANVPLLDQPGTNDPPGSVYRNQWTAALATAFGTSPHFYNMDNEIDIWGGTHRDVHPLPTAYNEMRDTFITEATALKVWDPKAIRLGPVSCCWWFYFNGADGNDKPAHAGVDFLPWWLNEVVWQDRISGTRSVDVFDIHAYPDGPDTSSWTQAQKQALAVRIYRDYWDPTYVSESSTINQPWVTQIQPNKTIPFRIPRMRAIANMIYPNTPLSMTEWSAAFAGESDFSTAIGDADAYGILGQQRVYLASRWTAPDPANPNYLALKLFTNYDGAHHGFATTSVSDTNSGDPDLFSSYAALNATGTMLTALVLNKDPANTVQAQFAINGFTPNKVTSYTLSSTNPTQIVASSTVAWSSTISFAPYSATLLVVTGTSKLPGAEWDLNPDTTMLAATGKVMLQPKIKSGSATVTLGIPQSDIGITVAVTQANVSTGTNGKITVTAGSTPGFYHYTVPSTDSAGVTQQQSGWILVGNPPATLTKTGDKQKGAVGSQLNLSVTLNPGSSGGSAAGGTILFTASAGSLSSRIVTTDSSGNAAVVLTLPSTAGTVHVTAEGQYGLGHPEVTFTETAQ
jgi:Glycoside hydrolase family 44